MTEKVLKGPNYHMDVPNESLGKIFYNSLIKQSNLPALIDNFTNETLTYDQILKITCQLSSVYENLGLKEGDLIAIYSENSIFYFLPMIAAFYLGIITVSMSHYYLEGELTHALNLTKPSILFCSKQSYKEYLKIRDKFKFVKHTVVMDSKEELNGVETFDTFINKYGKVNNVGVTLKDLDINKSIAFIYFSSGTTGLPKGVMLTHKNYICWTVQYRDPRLRYFNRKDVVLGFLPFDHLYGTVLYLTPILLGNTVRVFSKFNERAFLEAIQKYQITKICVVPTIAVLLAKSLTVDEYDLSSLEDIICGGSTLSENVEKRIIERLNVKYVRQIYGLTETNTSITIVPVNTLKKGSVGKLVPGMMGAIRNPNNGNFLGPYKLGEVILKGDMVMAGYFNNPIATKEAFLENGFYKTGDLGYYDEEENFFIIDRLKELIKYKSFQVAPAELEGLLLKHPKILDAAVVGLPDEEAGELPLAFIVKQPNGQDLKEGEIIQYVSDNVSNQKRLRGGVRFIEKIPKTPSGKILRKQLKRIIEN